MHNITQADQLLNCLDLIMAEPDHFRPRMIEEGIRRIEANLNSKSIHTLRPWLSKKASSPEFMCIMTNGELSDLAEALNAEIEFRKDAGVA